MIEEGVEYRLMRKFSMKRHCWLRIRMWRRTGGGEDVKPNSHLGNGF